MIRCKGVGEVVRVVDEEGRAQMRLWKRGLIEEALEGLVEEHYGRRWQRQREALPTPWTCLSCGPRDSTQVKRNGHYSRQLVVREGVIPLKVPQLCCRGCGRGLALGALFLPYRQRYWIDLDREITEAYLSGASYRQLKAMVERRIESGAGLMGLWRRFQGVAKRASTVGLKGPLKALYLDEAYTRIKGEAYWSLLALGEDDQGRRVYLGALPSPDRSQEAWPASGGLDGLEIPGEGRGLTILHDGDQAIAAAVAMVLPKAKTQPCLWHLLHNAFLQARERYGADPQKLRQVVGSVKAALEASAPMGPKTTSALERAIKEYRRRTRPMDGFGSEDGARNFLRVWMVKENARMAGQDWLKAVMG